MTQYIYPQNLKAKASLWLWGMRDFVILCIAALLSVVALPWKMFTACSMPTTGPAQTNSVPCPFRMW